MTRAESNSDLRVVFVTAPEAAVGRQIAHSLVESHLAACVNLVPGVTSIYRWQDEIQEDSEVLLVIKTRESRCADLAERVAQLHPYDVPEVLTLPVNGGSETYLSWLRGETSS